MAISRGFQRAVFNHGAATQKLVVAAPVNPLTKRIRVRGCILSAAGTVAIKFESDSTELATLNMVAGVPFPLPPTDGGKAEEWLICAAGEDLNITLGAAIQVDGVVFWDTVDVAAAP